MLKKQSMNEHDIFNEKQEIKRAVYACTFCGKQNEYDVRWLKRTKKKNARGLNQNQKTQFEKSKNYMVRIDDHLTVSYTHLTLPTTPYV